MRRASLQVASCESLPAMDQSWETQVRRVVFKAVKSCGEDTFSDKIQVSPETANRARIGMTCSSLAVRSFMLVVKDWSST